MGIGIAIGVCVVCCYCRKKRKGRGKYGEEEAETDGPAGLGATTGAESRPPPWDEAGTVRLDMTGLNGHAPGAKPNGVAVIPYEKDTGQYGTYGPQTATKATQTEDGDVHLWDVARVNSEERRA